ncbi:hypothetical protein KP509_02G042400 [Ceratopteris richardii]|uniref:Chitin-binding type-2 domain-containing protein n=1 Tax=Ceratopteris richardii TaxID=49495 RepID=A0A8T2VGN1_CERRI|nr:hypothetical protein KP509_02G042400 [Ceratopteris richardii]
MEAGRLNCASASIVLVMVIMEYLSMLSKGCNGMSTNLQHNDGAARNTSSTFCAGKDDGAYANPNSCSSFWVCWDDGREGSLLLCPPNTLWNVERVSCTALAHNVSNNSPVSNRTPSYNTLRLTNISNAINSTFKVNSSTSSFPSCFDLASPSAVLLNLPIWNWDGRLHCYGYGCQRRLNSNSKEPQRFSIGVPCEAAQQLLAIAERSKEAWIPVPRYAGAKVIPHTGRGQHWKIRFDEIAHGEDDGHHIMENRLKASIIDYSEVERVVNGWPIRGMKNAVQIVMEGPINEGSTCYYSVQMESSQMNATLRGAFVRDLLKLQATKATRGSSRLMNKRTQASMQLQAGGFNLDDDPIVHKIRHHHHGHGNIESCLTSIPWAGLFVTAVCYASNAGGGLQSMSLCGSDLPYHDLLTVAKCFSSILGIGSELGL